MGFTTMDYRKTVESLTNKQVERLQNPYYKWIQQKPTIVTYWSLDTHITTLDEGRKDTYAELGKKSSLMYNRIDGFALYGLPRIQVNLQMEEYGVQSSDIEVEGIILPNTIIPHVDDYFVYSYIKNTYLFRVTGQTLDTLENGANFYKIQATLDTTRDDFLKSLNGRQLLKVYKFDITRIGTNKSPILTEEDATSLNMLYEVYDKLRTNYQELFWRNNVQAFICGYDQWMWIYDPYLTEFIIRNDLFYNNGTDGEWIFVDQAVHKPRTFGIEYDNTIFADVENRNPKLHTNSAYAIPVHDPNSTLTDRLEQYFELSINIRNSELKPINQINMKLFDRIEQNDPFDEEDSSNRELYWNIIINWMNNEDYTITEAQLQSLLNMKYMYSKDMFYHIPILMYILKRYISRMESNGDTDEDGNTVNKYYMEQCYNTGK